MGLMMSINPRTATIFIILDPIIFPITKPDWLCLAATIDAASSGSDVPNATMDIPITSGETPRSMAIPFAPKTKVCAPNHKPTIPRINFRDIEKIFCLDKKISISSSIIVSFVYNCQQYPPNNTRNIIPCQKTRSPKKIKNSGSRVINSR